jgi:hypothetical protein
MMDYTSYIAQVANLMATDPNTPEFQLMIPGMINYAEKRIYRELDVVDTIWTSSTTCTPRDRVLITPPARYGSYITLTTVSLVGEDPPNIPFRIQLQPVTIFYLNSVWGTPKTTAKPQYFAPYRQDSFYLGPWPDRAYTIEVQGTYRPEPLSPTHPETFLTQFMPDIFLAASMVFASGYMRDFGSQSDNPQQAQSWESQYQTLAKGAMLESLRQKFAGPAWTSLSAIPIAPER